MTTGRLPFPGRNVMEILKSLATVTPAAPMSLNAVVSSDLSDLITRLLDKDRDARPASALTVGRQLAELEQVMPRADIAASPAPVSPQRMSNLCVETKPEKRRTLPARRVALTLTGFGLLAMLSVVIVSIRTKDGRVIEKTINVPGEVAEISVAVKDREPKKKPGKPRVVAGPSPFDELDPAVIPEEERFTWQPKELVAVLGSHRQRMWTGAASVAMSGDGSLCLAGGYDSKGLLVDVTNGRTLRTPTFHARCVGVSPDGTMLFWKQEDGRLSLMGREGETWKPREMSLPKAVAVWSHQPWDATFSIDGRWLATSILYEVLDEVPKYSTYVWDVSVDPPQRVVELHGFKHPSFSPDGKRLAVIATQKTNPLTRALSPDDGGRGDRKRLRTVRTRCRCLISVSCPRCATRSCQGWSFPATIALRFALATDFWPAVSWRPSTKLDCSPCGMSRPPSRSSSLNVI